MGENSLKAVIRPRRMRNDGIEDVRLDLFNMDGSPHALGEGGGGAGGGGAVSQLVQGQVELRADVNGGALLWGNESDLSALGIDLSEYVDTNEIPLPRGFYMSTFEFYIDPTEDDGPEDQDRALHLNLTGAPPEWSGRIAYGKDWWINKAGSWAESPNLQYIVFPFVIWAEHQTAQVYVTSSAAASVPFNVNLMIAKVADLPEE
jgi:hypothetical protein